MTFERWLDEVRGLSLSTRTLYVAQAERMVAHVDDFSTRTATDAYISQRLREKEISAGTASQLFTAARNYALFLGYEWDMPFSSKRKGRARVSRPKPMVGFLDWLLVQGYSLTTAKVYEGMVLNLYRRAEGDEAMIPYCAPEMEKTYGGTFRSAWRRYREFLEITGYGAIPLETPPALPDDVIFAVQCLLQSFGLSQKDVHALNRGDLLEARPRMGWGLCVTPNESRQAEVYARADYETGALMVLKRWSSDHGEHPLVPEVERGGTRVHRAVLRTIAHSSEDYEEPLRAIYRGGSRVPRERPEISLPDPTEYPKMPEELRSTPESLIDQASKKASASAPRPRPSLSSLEGVDALFDALVPPEEPRSP